MCELPHSAKRHKKSKLEKPKQMFREMRNKLHANVVSSSP